MFNRVDKKLRIAIALAIAAMLMTGCAGRGSAYNAAAELMEAGQYAEAIAAFEALDGYKDSADRIAECQYLAAAELMEAGQYAEAIAAFSALDGYKDSAEQIEACKAELLKNPVVGGSVYFGKYEQDNDLTNGEEDIEWLVLDIQDVRALLVSKYGLDCKPYNESLRKVTWEFCTLRTWLNEDFLNAAFSAEEQALIPTVTVSADRDRSYNTNPGRNTQDRVFLLSIVEAKKYFVSADERMCRPTEYAVANGTYASRDKDGNQDNGNCWWWLRSPGLDQLNAVIVYVGGTIRASGFDVDTSEGSAVRPAIWLDLNT